MIYLLISIFYSRVKCTQSVSFYCMPEFAQRQLQGLTKIAWIWIENTLDIKIYYVLQGHVLAFK